MSKTLELIKQDMLESRKVQNKVKSMLLGTLIAEICRDDKDPSEEKVQKSVSKFLKNIEKSIEIKRTSELEYERTIIEAYVPVQLVSGDYMMAVDKVITDNSDKELTEKTIGWFVGRVMKEVGGKANPASVKSYLESKLH